MEVSQTLEEKVLDMSARLESVKAELDSVKTELGTVKNELRDRASNPAKSVINDLEPILKERYRGKFVGLTHDGKIIDASENMLELFKRLEELKIPRDSSFIYEVR